MDWTTKVFLLSGWLAVAAVVLLKFALGLGWYALVAAPPTFLAISVLVPFFLGVRDRHMKIAYPRSQRRESRRFRARHANPPITGQPRKNTMPAHTANAASEERLGMAVPAAPR